MNKRSFAMVIVGLVLVLAGIVFYLISDPLEEHASRLLLENSGGRVIFTHTAHSTPGGAYGEASCSDCHHELKISLPKNGTTDAPPEVMKCAACHSSADDPNFAAQHQELYAKEGADRACADCHHAIVINGYSTLWQHEEHADYAGGDCSTCHHPVATAISGREMKHIRPQRCGDCHTPAPNHMTPTVTKDAGHKTCVLCHNDLFEGGAAGCKTCHTTQKPAEGQKKADFASCSDCHKSIVGSMDAFHGNCMGCHDKAAKGPGKTAPCTQCHAKT